MQHAVIALVVVCAILPLLAQEPGEGPADTKAQETYKKALQHLQRREILDALNGFKKADKQSQAHCLGCQKGMIKYGLLIEEWKTAETAATEMIAEANDNKESAAAHYELGVVLMREGGSKHKDELFSRAHDEMVKALADYANFPDAHYADGQVLAYLKRDDEAKARFSEFIKMKPADNLDRQRALRFLSRPELARARMAPAFWIKTMDGQRISLDDLQGRVVLLDFWATWCGPCREALPHMKQIVKKFQGEPLLVISIDLDDDEQKWEKFVAQNEMTWPQYFDGGFSGPISTLFGVHAIPHTFTIDSDGVLQDEHVGDASIEGKLKKLLAKAHEVQATENSAQANSPN